VVAHLADSADPAATEARHELQVAAWLAVAGYPNQMAGISHAVDHQLGALCDVPHGMGACCILPHAVRFNADAARPALALMAEEVARSGPRGGGTAEVPSGAPAPAAVVAAAVTHIVEELGLPSRLRDVGVPRELLPRVAAQALDDPTIAGNPRVVASAEEILAEVLEPAW
jgi:alcohol dehydrogenase class IV